MQTQMHAVLPNAGQREECLQLAVVRNLNTVQTKLVRVRQFMGRCSCVYAISSHGRKPSREIRRDFFGQLPFCDKNENRHVIYHQFLNASDIDCHLDVFLSAQGFLKQFSFIHRLSCHWRRHRALQMNVKVWHELFMTSGLRPQVNYH